MADMKFGVNLLPNADNTYDLGSSSLRWRNIYGTSSASATDPYIKYFWHDLFGFCTLCTPTYEETTNGSTWTTATLDKKIFDEKNITAITLYSGSIIAHRWTWNSIGGYTSGTWMQFGWAYATPLAKTTILVETSTDGTTWTQIGTASGSWAATNYALAVSNIGGNSRIRVTMTKTSETGTACLTNLRYLTDRPGNQGQGIELEFPYTWDEEKNITGKFIGSLTGNITGSSTSCTGNAATATKLATSRTISLTGSVTGSGSFDGSGNLSIATTTNHNHSYLPLSGGELTGGIRIYSTTAGTGYLRNSHVAIEIREAEAVGNAQSSYDYAPKIGFHWSNRTAKTLGLNSSGEFCFCGLNTNDANATIRAGAVYGAVWNDYAEYRESDITEPGRCIIENGDDTLSLSTKRLQRGCEIVSDTFGFAIGETDECKTPIAASGRVLAYPYEDKEEFRKHIGWPVCSGPNGTVSIMTEEEEERYPSRIIGTISAVPDYEEWGTGKVKVNGRVWIRIK